jgi:hypothetical protein
MCIKLVIKTSSMLCTLRGTCMVMLPFPDGRHVSRAETLIAVAASLLNVSLVKGLYMGVEV